MEENIATWKIHCPGCGYNIAPEWKSIQWERGNDGRLLQAPFIKCVVCNLHINDNDMLDSFGEGRFVKPFINKPATGGRVSNLYFLDWTKVVNQWKASKDDTLKIKTFTNEVLGEPWIDKKPTPPQDTGESEEI